MKEAVKDFIPEAQFKTEVPTNDYIGKFEVYVQDICVFSKRKYNQWPWIPTVAQTCKEVYHMLKERRSKEEIEKEIEIEKTWLLGNHRRAKSS